MQSDKRIRDLLSKINEERCLSSTRFRVNVRIKVDGDLYTTHFPYQDYESLIIAYRNAIIYRDHKSSMSAQAKVNTVVEGIYESISSKDGRQYMYLYFINPKFMKRYVGRIDPTDTTRDGIRQTPEYVRTMNELVILRNQ